MKQNYIWTFTPTITAPRASVSLATVGLTSAERTKAKILHSKKLFCVTLTGSVTHCSYLVEDLIAAITRELPEKNDDGGLYYGMGWNDCLEKCLERFKG